ncbi:MAG: Gfo/Idh/MocA family oxidoreductase [Symbiobacteriaceae bacterium]|nr:Gfo/Idh/MocA family oxidoreductase [Symbiobacteriaceae bacterium]
MSSAKIGIGIIGAGNIAQNAHIPAYALQRDCEVVAIYDSHVGRAAEAVAKLGIGQVAASLEELLSNPRVDAVSICSINQAHGVSAVAAAKAGKHILCEKPMAVSVVEAEAMAQAAKDAGVVLLMGMIHRYSSEAVIIKALAEEGGFGDIYYARASSLRRRGTPLGWFTDVHKSGGGAVIDIGVHLLDLTWYLMGKPEPVAVSASTHYHIGDYQTQGVARWEAFDVDDLAFNVEDSACGIIRFANNASLLFDVSWALNGSPTPQPSAWLYGSKAGCSLNPLVIFGETAGYLSDNKPIYLPRTIADMFGLQARHFLDCIHGLDTPLTPAVDGVTVQKMLNGIYASAAAGKEVYL